MSLWDFTKVVLTALMGAVHCAPPAAEAPSTGFSQQREWQQISRSMIAGTCCSYSSHLVWGTSNIEAGLRAHRRFDERRLHLQYNFIALLQIPITASVGKDSGFLEVCTGSLFTTQHGEDPWTTRHQLLEALTARKTYLHSRVSIFNQCC